MNKMIRVAMAIVMGGMVFASAGNVLAGDTVDVGLFEMSRSDFNDLRAMVAGEPVSNRVYSQPADTEVAGVLEMNKADLDRIKNLVSGKASVSDTAVYAKPKKMVNIGLIEMSQADLDSLRNKVGSGPVVRLAERIDHVSGTVN